MREPEESSPRRTCDVELRPATNYPSVQVRCRLYLPISAVRNRRSPRYDAGMPVPGGSVD